MSILVKFLIRSWFYVGMVLIAILLLDPQKMRSTALFLGTLAYMAGVWIIFIFPKSRIYECKPISLATAYGLLLLAPPFLFASGAYGTACMTAYLLAVASTIVPVPQFDTYKYVMADAEELKLKREAALRRKGQR